VALLPARYLLSADPLELRCQELEHVAVEGSVVVANGADDSGEVASVGIIVALRHPGVVVDLRSSDVC